MLIIVSQSSLCQILSPCGSSDAAAKILYMTLQDHVIIGSGDFIEGKSSLYIPTLPKLIAIAVVLMDM